MSTGNSMITETAPRHDPQKYWQYVCRRWPEFFLLSRFFLRAPDIAQRYGMQYCRGQWFRGPKGVREGAGVSIPEVGVLRATIALMMRNRVRLDALTMVVAELMPPCLHPDCASGCVGGFMPTSNERQP